MSDAHDRDKAEAFESQRPVSMFRCMCGHTKANHVSWGCLGIVEGSRCTCAEFQEKSWMNIHAPDVLEEEERLQLREQIAAQQRVEERRRQRKEES